MAKYRKCTKTTVAGVLRRMVEQAESDLDDYGQTYAAELNILLDDLLDQDYFGTEGQNDPRGDHRD